MEVGEVMVATKVINGTMYSLSIKKPGHFHPTIDRNGERYKALLLNVHKEDLAQKSMLWVHSEAR